MLHRIKTILMEGKPRILVITSVCTLAVITLLLALSACANANTIADISKINSSPVVSTATQADQPTNVIKVQQDAERINETFSSPSNVASCCNTTESGNTLETTGSVITPSTAATCCGDTSGTNSPSVPVKTPSSAAKGSCCQ